MISKQRIERAAGRARLDLVAGGQPELPLGQRVALDRLAKRELPLLSAISLWEAQVLNAKARLKLDRPLERWWREAASPEVVRIPLDVESC